MEKNCDYDSVVVGSGPNGLAAAITLRQRGLSVLLIEKASTIGGGMRTKELNPGFFHDICSAIHPLGISSSFFKSLPLDKFGLEWIHSEYELAHPFEDGHVALLKRSMEATAETLGKDGETYLNLMKQPVEDWELYSNDILGPLKIPGHPLALSRFGMKAILSATSFCSRFKDKYAKGFFAGLAAHSQIPLDRIATAAVGMVFSISGHREGWPLPKGGAQSLANALHKYYTSIGGKTELNLHIRDFGQLPKARAFLFDLTPKQLMEIAGQKFSSFYKWQLQNFKYGVGIFKLDFELSGRVPFKSEECLKAATVHLGSTLEEIVAAEKAPHENKICENPFLLLAQQSLFDDSRSPEGYHTLWSYCHVPAGSTYDMTNNIINKIEKFAPGFRDLIVDKHTMNTKEVEIYNPNYINGDINGGMQDIFQLFTRPVVRWSPYTTSAHNIFICSSSTPPGGGVHGLCGFHAARKALQVIFKIKI